MPSPPSTRLNNIQFSAPMTFTTILDTVRISVPFRKLLSLFISFSLKMQTKIHDNIIAFDKHFMGFFIIRYQICLRYR